MRLDFSPQLNLTFPPFFFVAYYLNPYATNQLVATKQKSAKYEYEFAREPHFAESEVRLSWGKK
jgi:hypothetical protein